MQEKEIERTPKNLSRWFEEQARGLRAFVKSVHDTDRMLSALDRSYSRLLSDDDFLTLLRAEGVNTIPNVLLERVGRRVS
jgi:hypothetical protein